MNFWLLSLNFNTNEWVAIKIQKHPLFITLSWLHVDIICEKQEINFNLIDNFNIYLRLSFVPVDISCHACQTHFIFQDFSLLWVMTEFINHTEL